MLHITIRNANITTIYIKNKNNVYNSTLISYKQTLISYKYLTYNKLQFTIYNRVEIQGIRVDQAKPTLWSISIKVLHC